MSYFSKLWNKWFGTKPARSTPPQSTATTSYRVGSPSLSTTTVPTKIKSETTKSTSRGQGNSYYDESRSHIGVDPLTVAIVASSLNCDSAQSSPSENSPVNTPTEPSAHLSPYESNSAQHSHSDAPSVSHHDSGYSHHDSGGGYSYDSGSSYSDSGGGGCDSGGCGCGD